MTKKPVVRRSLAEDDIDAAFTYYLYEAGTEIAADFVAQFEKITVSISSLPTLGSPRYGHELMLPGMRYRAMRCFPYLIFYVEKENRIELVRVLHTSREISSLIDESE